MNILITGGAGFIGSYLANLHLNKGDNVCVIDNLSTGSEKNIAPFKSNPLFHFEIDDILTWSHLATRVAWADRIYHLAALVGMYHLLAHPIATLRTNILGCERLLRTIEENNIHTRLMVASSSEIYGPSPKLSLQEDDLLLFKSSSQGKWVYACSKFADEIFSLAYAREKGVRVTLLRLFNTIGPRQNGRYGMVVPRFIDQAVNHKPITVYGDGEQTRSFCDVRDTITVMDILANNPEAIGEVINIGQNHPITINNLALLIKQLANSNSVIEHIDYDKAYGQAYEDIMHRCPDLTKFREFTAYQFQWSLEKTLTDLISLKKASN